MDEQRKAFEAWWMAYFNDADISWSDVYCTYRQTDTARAWAAWQAATVVERERCANAVDNWMRREDMTGDDIRKG